MKHVTKATGLVEAYSADKLQLSIIRTLQSVHVEEPSASRITNNVMNATAQWLDNKSEVTVVDIRSFVARQLAKADKDAAVVYKKHKDMW